MWWWNVQPKTTWWSDVIALREYNGIVSIHIMLLTANISQLLAIATLPTTDDSGQKVPLVAMCCSDHFIVHVLHTLRIQSQGRVETYSIQLSTRMVYLVQVLKIYYYVEKLTLQAWHYTIAAGDRSFGDRGSMFRTRVGTFKFSTWHYYWRLTVSGESWIVYYLGRISARDAELHWYHLCNIRMKGNCNLQQ